MPAHRFSVVGLVALLAGHLAWAAEPAKTPAFNADVRPILKAYCTECHGEAEKPKGGLDLRLRRFVVQGGASGPAVVEGKPDESLLLAKLPMEARADARSSSLVAHQ